MFESTSSPDERAVCDYFQSLTRIAIAALDAAAVVLVTLDGDRLRLRGCSGADELSEALESLLFAHLRDDSGRFVDDDVRRERPLYIAGVPVVGYATEPVHDASGDVIGAVCAFDDSPRRWTEPRLAVLQDVARMASHRIAIAERTSRSARDVAHDLKSPLNVVAVGVQSIQEQKVVTDEPQIARLLKIMGRSVTDAVAICERMGRDFDPDAIELVTIVEGACDAIENARVQRHLPPPGIATTANPVALKRFVGDLVSAMCGGTSAGVVRVVVRGESFELQVEGEAPEGGLEPLRFAAESLQGRLEVRGEPTRDVATATLPLRPRAPDSVSGSATPVRAGARGR